MWSVFKTNPVRAVVTLAYLAFVAIYLVIGFSPAQAEGQITGTLIIPSAGIAADVTPSTLTDGEFYVPSHIVGAYTRARKTFLMAHSTTAFANLHLTEVGAEIFYGGRLYRVTSRRQLPVAAVSMREVLRDDDALVLMTCAGENDSERLIITAR